LEQAAGRQHIDGVHITLPKSPAPGTTARSKEKTPPCPRPPKPPRGLKAAVHGDESVLEEHRLDRLVAKK